MRFVASLWSLLTAGQPYESEIASGQGLPAAWYFCFGPDRKGLHLHAPRLLSLVLREVEVERLAVARDDRADIRTIALDREIRRRLWKADAAGDEQPSRRKSHNAVARERGHNARLQRVAIVRHAVDFGAEVGWVEDGGHLIFLRAMSALAASSQIWIA